MAERLPRYDLPPASYYYDDALQISKLAFYGPNTQYDVPALQDALRQSPHPLLHEIELNTSGINPGNGTVHYTQPYRDLNSAYELAWGAVRTINASQDIVVLRLLTLAREGPFWHSLMFTAAGYYVAFDTRCKEDQPPTAPVPFLVQKYTGHTPNYRLSPLAISEADAVLWEMRAAHTALTH